MILDVPAHVAYPAYVQNGVVLRGATNWDLSRGATATPIQLLADPPLVTTGENVEASVAPVYTKYIASDKMPANAPAFTANFLEGHAIVSREVRAEIRQLDKGIRYVVAGHADASEKNPELLSRQRANAVAAQMKRQGFKVSLIKSFGDRKGLEAHSSAAASNSRVDIVASD